MNPMTRYEGHRDGVNRFCLGRLVEKGELAKLVRMEKV